MAKVIPRSSVPNLVYGPRRSLNMQGQLMCRTREKNRVREVSGSVGQVGSTRMQAVQLYKRSQDLLEIQRLTCDAMDNALVVT